MSQLDEGARRLLGGEPARVEVRHHHVPQRRVGAAGAHEPELVARRRRLRRRCGRLRGGVGAAGAGGLRPAPRTRSATHRRRRIAGGGAASRLSSRGGCYGSRARPLSPLPPPLRLTRGGRRGPSTSRIRRPRSRASRGGRARGRSSRRSARGTTSSTSAARGALPASPLHRRPDPEQRLALRVVEEPLRERRVPPRVSHASELGRAGRGPRRLCSSHGVATKKEKAPSVGVKQT